jgi:tripartite-type tricarboxylate transporter receptor subunit TctC
MIGRWLSERLGQPFIVENRAGASGNIATESVARAPSDGYTLLLVGPANAINASLHPGARDYFMRYIALVAGITREPLVMLVHPSVPAYTAADFMEHARSRPGQIRMASTGSASSPHLAGLMFTRRSGVDLNIVHYPGGGPALKEMISGRAQVMFEPMSAAIGPVRSGQLRALAVTTADRSDALPDVPTMAEWLPGYQASAVTGIGVPMNTPTAIIDLLNREVNAAFADPNMKSLLRGTGGTVLPGSPEDFKRIVTNEIENWGEAASASGAGKD